MARWSPREKVSAMSLAVGLRQQNGVKRGSPLEGVIAIASGLLSFAFADPALALFDPIGAAGENPRLKRSQQSR